MMNSIYTSLQSFIKSTPDFRVMTTSEQCSLFQRNIQGLLAFYCVFVFRESGVFINKTTEYSLIPLYGFDNVQCTKRISIRLEFDLTLIKLMLITLSFCSNCYMISEEDNLVRDSLLYGSFRLFGSQNVYAELLWRYMTYRYGFWEAARRFDALIKVALDALTLSSNIYNDNKVHQNFADEKAEASERLLILSNNAVEPLWGRKEY